MKELFGLPVIKDRELANGSHEITLEIENELFAKMERMREILSETIPNATMGDVLTEIARETIREHERKEAMN